MTKKVSAFLSGFAAVIFSFGISATAVDAQSESDVSSPEFLIGCAKEIVSWEKSSLGISEVDSLFSGDFLAAAGEQSADWYVIGASRLGLQEDYSAYAEALCQSVSRLSESSKATDWHRLILAVCACGENPVDFSEVNLADKGIYGRNENNSLGSQGVNGWIWGLLALDSVCIETPESCLFDREYIISQILSLQLSDGGFALSGQVGETDLTAMAVQALAPYINDGNSDSVRNAVNEALGFLSCNQQDNGGFSTCESTAQVLCALCSAGIDYKTDERFIKNQNILDALLEYRNSDGGFAHEVGGKSESMSSAQAMLACASAVRYEKTLRRLYDFREEFSQSDREKLNEINNMISDKSADKESISECYSGLSADMRSYVRGSDEIEDINTDGKSFTEEMSQNQSAKGYIYDIENNREFSPEDNYAAEIDSINAEIMDGLYPFENLSAEKQKAAEQIYDRVMKLPEKYRSKITGYEQLCELHNGGDKSKRTLVFIGATAAVTILAAAVIIVRKRKYGGIV